MLTVAFCLIAISLLVGGGAMTLFAARRSLRRSYDQSIETVRTTAAEAEWKLQQITRAGFEAMTEAARHRNAG